MITLRDGKVAQKRIVLLVKYDRARFDAAVDHRMSMRIAYLDETGARVAGKLHWLHSAGNTHATLYVIHPKRGSDGMDALGVLPDRTDWCVHNGWKAYFKYPVRHALCNAHHLRELTFIHEQYHPQWAADLRHWLCRIKTSVENARQSGQSALPLDQTAYFRLRYDRLLDAAEREIGVPLPPAPSRPSKHSPPTNLLNRLREGSAQVLAFMNDFTVPFDNNAAERDIRMVKVQQKVSGGFRTLPGADLFCTVRSYLATARKNGQSALVALTQALRADPYHSPCLLPPRLSSHGYSTDALRIHERMNPDTGSNDRIYSEVMQGVERVWVIHILRTLEKQRWLTSMKRLAILIDGPLAIFGQPAWISQAIFVELKRLNALVREATGQDMLLLGIEKGGEFAEHFEQIDRNENGIEGVFPKKTAALLTDGYIKQNIYFSDSTKLYGEGAYFGRNFF